jgi:MFS family permease
MMKTRLTCHYAVVVVIITFFVMLFAAGIRTIPSVIIKPLEGEYDWTRASLSLGVAINLFAFGFGGPIARSLMDRFGPRRIMLGGLAFTAQRFGRGSLASIYGWIFCSHMIGADIAAQAGGIFRDWLGDYHIIFLSAAALGFVASLMSMQISVKPNRARPVPA